MVLHDFRCTTHGLFQKLQALEELQDFEPCPECGSPSRKTFETFNQGNGGVRVWKPRWFEHIGPKPVYIESKNQLRKECEKHGCESLYLKDGYNQ